MEDRLSAQVALQEKIERKHLELERTLSSSESQRRIADQHHATREAELVTINTELATEKEKIEATLLQGKSEILRLQRGLEETQSDLRNKTQFHEKLTKLHNEQIAANVALSDELAQEKRAQAALTAAHALEVESLQSKVNLLKLSGDESNAGLTTRIQSLEDALISTSQDLNRTAEQLASAEAQVKELTLTKATLSASLAELQTENQILSVQLASQTQEATASTQRVAELTHFRSELNENVAALQEQVHQLQLGCTRHQNEAETTKKQLQRVEDELRDTARKLETAEDRIHYLQDIAIPDLNNSAMETVEKSKSEQVNSVFLMERKIISDYILMFHFFIMCYLEPF